MAGKPFPELSFVTATTNLDGFKDKKVMRKVRKVVMKNYLDKAKEDPNTTDVRAKKRESPTPLKSEARTPTVQSPSDMPAPSILRRDSMTSFERRTSGYARSTSSRPSSIASSTGSTHSGHAINPMIPPTPNQEWLFGIADELNRKAARPTAFDTRADFEAILAPGSKITAQKMEFLVAFTRGEAEKASADVFAQHTALPPTVDLDRLKINCATFFGSAGMSEQWLPLMMLSPQSFLASLCVSAPYTDLMTAIYRGDDPSKYTETRQTMEILDILPRMINDALNEHGSSDGNITSVAQLLLGQLSTPYTALIGSHQSALKRMVAQRGGLDKLGGNGALAMNLSLINAEANILRSEPVEQQYLTWISSHLNRNENKIQKLPAPEGPLLWVSRGMLSVKLSPLCRPETFQLIELMYELNEKVIRLQRLEENEKAGSMDVNILQSTEQAEIRFRIRQIVGQVYDFPHCHKLVPTGPPDWVYETLRLSSLIFSHAVFQRRPLHMQHECTFGHNCCVLPDMIQEAVQQTPIRPVWDHLAGVLYWALMIAAASCHDPVGETYDSDTPSIETPSSNNANPVHAQPYPTRSATVPPLPATSATPGTTITPPPPSSSAPPANDEQRQEALQFAAQTWSKGKSMFEQYVYARDTDVVGGLMSGMNISEGQPAPSFMPTAGPGSPSSVPLYYHDSGFVSMMGPPATPSPKEENKRLRLEARSPQSEAEARRQKEKRAYVKRFLTANAVRVSILLRFEHTTAMVQSVQRLEEVTRWLARR
ncbi:hypothetical protein BDZ85DRAFT_264501 [Elsinoe ampelina]|uniref:Uncharacterized protein n=1 Tax=Elsinoe ampelina TaxID=302913 RepID=A0A6A6G7W3_9PEZI|nr:hypothetical protein BDZ85DRAFT_264501 [Elsinoe ampelina]